MSTNANKALIRRFYDEVWNQGNLAVADEVFAADYVRHDHRPGAVPPGPEGQKRIAETFRSAFPDGRMSIELMVAEGSFVVAQWTIEGTHSGTWAAISATGARVRFGGVNIFRLTDGKVVEIWNHRDDLGLMQQLGAPSVSGHEV
ncbi:MAG: ester cyclase [Nocardioidaceae bacterium]|nr:ester cyclase [Nocardioidaceae bacterium]